MLALLFIYLGVFLPSLVTATHQSVLSTNAAASHGMPRLSLQGQGHQGMHRGRVFGARGTEHRGYLHNLVRHGLIMNKTLLGHDMIYYDIDDTTDKEGFSRCELFDMKNFNHVHPYRQCIRPAASGELISDMIRTTGAYGRDFEGGCNSLLYLWAISLVHGNGLFVDVGGNIGTCTLLLTANGAETVAFEPMPSNYRVFVKSIQANKDLFGNRIKLYPYGLGDKDYNTTAFLQVNNMGNSVIDKAIPIKRRDQMVPQEVMVKVMDDVLWPLRKGYLDGTDIHMGPPLINMMKLDAQGFEMKVLLGAKNLIECGAIKVISFEIEDRFLEAQGTSANAICDFLIQHHYIISTKDGRILQKDQCTKEPIGDLWAKLMRPRNETCV